MVPNTISSYFTMVAGQKARATHVNTNFSNHRGTLLPINEDTASASHQVHDLGSSEHNWRRIYLEEAPYINGTQGGKVRIEDWYDGENPPDLVDPIANLQRTAFPKSVDTDVRFGFRVPDEYTPGNRISLRFQGYCETSPGFRIQTESNLYKDSITSANLTAPSNVLTSTADFAAPTTAGLFFEKTSLRLTDASGLINSVTVTAGDFIAVNFKRKGAATQDTMAGYFYLTGLVVDLNL